MQTELDTYSSGRSCNFCETASTGKDIVCKTRLYPTVSVYLHVKRVPPVLVGSSPRFLFLSLELSVPIQEYSNTLLQIASKPPRYVNPFASNSRAIIIHFFTIKRKKYFILIKNLRSIIFQFLPRYFLHRNIVCRGKELDLKNYFANKRESFNFARSNTFLFVLFLLLLLLSSLFFFVRFESPIGARLREETSRSPPSSLTVAAFRRCHEENNIVECHHAVVMKLSTSLL